MPDDLDAVRHGFSAKLGAWHHKAAPLVRQNRRAGPGSALGARKATGRASVWPGCGPRFPGNTPREPVSEVFDLGKGQSAGSVAVGRKENLLRRYRCQSRGAALD